MITLVDKRTYTEICEIFRYISKEELNKIPSDIIEYYEKNKDETYEFKYDSSKTLIEQNVSRNTSALIIYLFNTYFATSDEKEKINNILEYNENKYQIELRGKYNPDKIFENRKKEKIEQEESTDLIQYKENLITSILNKIKQLFKRNK